MLRLARFARRLDVRQNDDDGTAGRRTMTTEPVEHPMRPAGGEGQARD